MHILNTSLPSLLPQEEHFVKYFRAATPELELGSLNIGSRCGQSAFWLISYAL
jgi:phosphoenolpyruvate carboxylase